MLSIAYYEVQVITGFDVDPGDAIAIAASAASARSKTILGQLAVGLGLICRTRFPGGNLTLQKPSISMPLETDPCFVGVFHTLNQRHAQLYH